MSDLLFKRASILVISFCLLKTISAHGQVIPDNTVDSRVTRQGNTFVIENGTAKGGNLFHSFQNFSVQTGGTAYFNNAANIQNIFSRVTGTSASSIDGILRANGTANLFFLNPNGILFSQNASLDLGGSFLATTANRIQFGDGVQFSSLPSETPPLLTSAPPVSLQIGSNPGDIRVTNTGHQLTASLFQPVLTNDTPPGLQVSPGQTLALVGGDVLLNGGTVFAPGGRIEVGSVKQGQVRVDTSSPQWSFSYSPENTFGRIDLSNESLLDASGLGGAALELNGQEIILKGDSAVLIQNRGVKPDKGLVVRATDLIDVTGLTPVEAVRTRIATESLNLGASAPLSLLSPKVIVRDGALVGSRTFSPARGGNVSIKAPKYLRIEGASPRFNGGISLLTALAFGPGKAGDVNITTPHLEIAKGGRLSSSTFGQGEGGKVRVVADLIEVTGFEPQLLQSSTLTSESIGSGNAGSLVIDTSKLILTNGGTVNTSLVSSGNGGDLEITARDSIEIRGNPGPNTPASLSANAVQIPPPLRRILRLPPVPSGNSGSVTINTPQLSVMSGGLVAVRNEGSGNAGELNISASEIIVDGNSLISATTLGGEGGNINLDANSVFLRDSSITASTQQLGTGGNISVNTGILVALGKTVISANAEDAQGGNINISALGIFLSPDTQITATSQLGTQFDGSVEVEAEITDFSQDPDLNVQVDPPDLYSACGDSNSTNLAYYRVGTAGKPTSPTTRSPADGGWLQAAKARYDQRQLTYVDPATGEIKPLKRVVGWKSNPNGTITFVNDPRKADQYAPAVAAQLKACHIDQQAKAG